MAENSERQENLEEIKKYMIKTLKKEEKLTTEQLNKLLIEANENVEFLKVLDEINIDSTGKRVIFVDGKACLVYDNGVFYIEDSVDSKKKKKKLTRNEATQLYVEYFFRYIMNPAIERKKMLENVRSITVKTKKVSEKDKTEMKKDSMKKTSVKSKVKEVKTEEVEKPKNKDKQEMIR